MPPTTATTPQEKIRELLEKSALVGIVLPDESNLDTLITAEILCRILETRGKTAGFLNAPRHREASLETPRLLCAVRTAHTLVKEFIISLDATRFPVAQLRYEKTGERLDIILSPKNAPVMREGISFREGSVRCDCIIAIGIPTLEEVTHRTAGTAEVVAETPVINLDNTVENKGYGTITFMIPPDRALGEAAYRIAQQWLGTPPEGELATLALAAVMYKTDTFRTQGIAPEMLLAASELMRRGADHRAALEMATASDPFDLIQLCSRAAVRSKLTQDGKILWSFITGDDFKKTGRSPRDIPSVLRHLEQRMPAHELRVVLWQDSDAHEIIRTTLAGAPTHMDIIRSRMPATATANLLTITASFTSFQEAEDALTAALHSPDLPSVAREEL
ncbi:MAG: hypothetical protein Q8Q94_01525 [bacterium]|nr:hypothetical protein [bacterium]MDZ4299828.1 hypothetical protein [Candidatus Sungbacteria bacterium]